MVEAFDAASANQTLQGYTILLAWVVAGTLLDLVVLRRLRRFALERGWMLGQVVFTALAGQPFFWFSFIGIFTTLAQVAPSVRINEVVRSLLSILGPLAITLFVIRLITSSVRVSLYSREIRSISLIENSLRILGGAVLIGTTFVLLGVPISPLITVLAGSSIGLSLALREPLSNLFSGMTVLASDKIQPGDYIRLSTGQEGYVTDIRWADTCIREMANNLVVIPNSLMAGTIITNFYRPEPELSVLFELGMPYSSDLNRMEELVLAVADEVHNEVPGGVPSFTPLVRFHTFGETSVRCTIILRAATFVDQFPIRHEFTKRLQIRFEREGLPLPVPMQVLRLDPASATELAAQATARPVPPDAARQAGPAGPHQAT